MASDAEFVEYVAERFEARHSVTAKKMFGEYGLFTSGKIFALICDNRLFFKPTEAGRAFIGEPALAPPYPGAKDSFLIEDRIDDSEWLNGLLEVSAPELPEPRKKRRK